MFVDEEIKQIEVNPPPARTSYPQEISNYGNFSEIGYMGNHI